MSMIYIVLPLAIVLAVVAVGGFIWAVKRGNTTTWTRHRSGCCTTTKKRRLRRKNPPIPGPHRRLIRRTI